MCEFTTVSSEIVKAENRPQSFLKKQTETAVRGRPRLQDKTSTSAKVRVDPLETQDGANRRRQRGETQ